MYVFVPHLCSTFRDLFRPDSANSVRGAFPARTPRAPAVEKIERKKKTIITLPRRRRSVAGTTLVSRDDSAVIKAIFFYHYYRYRYRYLFILFLLLFSPVFALSESPDVAARNSIRPARARVPLSRSRGRRAPVPVITCPRSARPDLLLKPKTSTAPPPPPPLLKMSKSQRATYAHNEWGGGVAKWQHVGGGANVS